MERITSLQNSKIKNIIRLHKAQERKEQQLFLVEGRKEIELALSAGYNMFSIFFCPELFEPNFNINAVLNKVENSFEITSEVFAKIAYREKSDGLMGVFKQRHLSINQLSAGNNPLIIVLESVEKPGNLGAILRTADAASVSAVIVCDPRTDIFNPNIVRSSLGCLFTNKVVVCSNDEALHFLKKNNINIYSAALHPESKQYDQFDYKKPTAIVMGTEADGLSKFWLNNCNEKIIIPMLGKIDSLNVSNSTAILAYEIMRQRDFKKTV